MAGEFITQPLQVPSLNNQYYNMMSKITDLPILDKIPPKFSNTSIELDGKFFELPRALRRYVKNTGNWSRLVGKLWQAPVDLGDIGKANFMYMEKGGRVRVAGLVGAGQSGATSEHRLQICRQLCYPADCFAVPTHRSV